MPEGCSWQTTNLHETKLAHAIVLLDAASTESEVPLRMMKLPAPAIAAIPPDRPAQLSTRIPARPVAKFKAKTPTVVSAVPEPDLDSDNIQHVLDIGTAILFRDQFCRRRQVRKSLETE